jgi:flagellar export protein FliJ
MAQFKFNLQVVLEQREREERLAQMAFAQAQLVQKQHEADLARIEGELRGANDYLRDHHLVGQIDTTMIASHRRFLIAMRSSVIAVAQQIAAARLKVEAAQRKLAAAAKDTKAIEVLRDRQKQRWMAEQEKKELALADDVAMQIAYHNLVEHDAAAALAGGAR